MKPLSFQDIPQRTTYIWKKKDDLIFVISLKTGRESILNSKYAMIWLLIDGRKTIDQIYSELKSDLLHRYQLIGMIKQLHFLGLVTFQNFLWGGHVHESISQ